MARFACKLSPPLPGGPKYQMNACVCELIDGGDVVRIMAVVAGA